MSIESRHHQASAELFMSADDHMHLRDEMTRVARELMLQKTPDTFTTELSGIPLQGEMPRTFGHLGNHHRRMNFEANKTSSHEPEDASMKLWLMGSPFPAEQIVLESEHLPVEFGLNKQFFFGSTVRDERPHRISCGDLFFVLDDLIPDTGRFSALVDPRTDHPFDYAALAAGDLLRSRAAKEKTIRQYRSKDYNVSLFEVPKPDGTVDVQTYLGQIGCGLEVQQTDKRSSIELTSAAAVDIDGAHVIELFKYRFAPNDKKPMSSHASLSMASSTLSRAKLNEYLKSTQQRISPVDIGARALQTLQADIS